MSRHRTVGGWTRPRQPAVSRQGASRHFKESQGANRQVIGGFHATAEESLGASKNGGLSHGLSHGPRSRPTSGRHRTRRRINWPWRIAAIANLTLAAVVTVGGLARLADAPAVPVAAVAPNEACWHLELHWALADIDPAGRMPVAVAELDGVWGRTNLSTGLVRIDPDVPCGQVRGTVAHEWAHFQQHRIYGSYEAAVEALPSIEINADCVADYLVPGRRSYIGGRECTPDERWAAALTRQGLPV